MSIATDLAAEREAESPPPTTKRVRIVETREVYANLPADRADGLLDDDVDVTDIAEELDRLRRIAHGNLNPHSEGGLHVKDASDVHLVTSWDPEPLDGTGKPSYLWTARRKVADARYELNRGRYLEGNCPELDEANRDLGRIEERLRVMALAAQGLDEHHRPLPETEGPCIGGDYCGRTTNGWFEAGSHGPGYYCGWCEAVPA